MDNIENIYSLSPLQQGLLFYTVAEPESRVYQQQLSLRIDGQLDPHAFAEAWRRLLARHAVLRTAILWEELDEAYQVVLTQVTLPLVELDWRVSEDAEKDLAELEISERDRPLDLANPPLMRICLVRLADRRWHMVWTHHHIVLDGWSEGIVFSEWLNCYGALTDGSVPQLPPTRPFQDYIAWLAQQDEAAAEAFWRGRLGAVEAATPLPSFATRSNVSATHLPHAEQMLVLSAEQSLRLADFARAERVTLNTLVQAAWALLLGSYAGRDEALFGITLGGRPDTLAHAEDMVGLFINTLPLKIEWRDPIAVGDWLRRVQNEVAELRQYEFSALHRLKNLSALPAGQPLFEAILVFENFPLDAALANLPHGLRLDARDGGVLTGDVRLTQGRNNFPLSLIAIPSGAGFEFVLSYARDRFSDAQIRLMLRHLQAVLLALTDRADRPLADLHWLAAEEAQQVIAWGIGKTVPVPPCGLHHLFEAHTDRHPNQTALITPNGTWSYAELEENANRLANYLLSLNVQPGQFVALGLERSVEFVVALMAVLKAGTAYLPLDVKQPPVRLAELLNDSQAALLLTHSRWQRQFQQASPRQLALDTLMPTLATQSPIRPQVKIAPEDAAYLIYTSGSTGTPKGVLVEHRAIVDYVTGVLATLPLPPAARYAMVSTVAADLGHTQLFGALAGGGTLVLPDEDTAFNPDALAHFLEQTGVDVLKLTPSHLRGLLKARPRADLLPRHTLIFGGESLSVDLVETVRALKADLQIVNHYGPTETAVGAVCQVLPTALDDLRPVALGNPLPNRFLHVLDTRQRPVPIGVPGELYIGGSALARGYWQRPELTAERFVQSPVAGRLYRTGDRVRWLAEGQLEFLGRVDNQIKLRGFRIELGEVEAQIQKLSPEIRQTLVRLVQTPDQAPRLIAYVVADSALSAEKLRDDLAMRVPDYLVPAAFIQLDSIPLNANGKVDAKNLPVPGAVAADGRLRVAPRTDTERQLAEIWQAVLNVDSIGIHDNFFSLGGDSILNLQIIARASQIGLKFTPKQLFEHRTIAGLAALLRPDEQIGQDPAQRPPQIVPLTAGQLARLDAGPLGSTWRAIALTGTLSHQVLSRALTALRQHHRVLQMALTDNDGSWRQSLAAAAKPAEVECVEETQCSQATLTALAAAAFNRLDLKQGQTLRACLINGGDSCILLLVSHPLVLDEAAWSIVLGDLNLALSQLEQDRPVTLGWTGGDWLAWGEHQRHYAQQELDASWEYWLQHAGTEFKTLPAPSAMAQQYGVTQQSYGVVTRQNCLLRFDRHTSSRLEQLRRKAQLSWEAILTCALAKAAGDELADVANGELADDRLLLDLQSGRPQLDRLPLTAPIARADFDPSRMVGALSHSAPLFLSCRHKASLADQLLAIEQQLAERPQYGADYGVLRYLSENVYLQEPLKSLPVPQLAVAWLGNWDSPLEHGHSLKELVAGSFMEGGFMEKSPEEESARLLQVNAWVKGGNLCLNLQGVLAAPWQESLRSHLLALAELQLDGPASTAFPLCGTEDSRLSLDRGDLDWDNIESVYPLSAMQQGMLLHTQLAPESGVYLVQERFTWQGPCDKTALERSWEKLLARHPVLRSGFHDYGAPVQYVCRTVPPNIDWYDWRELTPEVQARQLEDLLSAERHRGFNLGRPPLIRLRLIRIDDHNAWLVRSFHHLLSDAWSFNLIILEWFALYQAERQATPVALPRPRPFEHYVRWQLRQDLTDAKAFWTAELHGFAEPTPLVIGRRPANGTVSATAVTELHLSVALTEQLQRRCEQYQFTPNTWVQGAWALLLSRYSGRRDLVFGITVAGRPSDLAGVADMAGVFINTLPLRVMLTDEQPVGEFLKQLFERNLAVRQFEHTPLALIQSWSEMGGGKPLFESLLVYENAPLEIAKANRGLEFSLDLAEDRSPTNYPLNLVVMPGSRLGLRLSYDADQFDPPALERLLAHLGQLLADMLARPEAATADMRLLTPAEQDQIFVQWNDSAHPFPLDRTYADLFAERVDQHPDRVAAVCMGESWTYRELDERANRLAHALHKAGAGPDTLVALCAERGLSLLAMMIGVFKAGAAYQPLDVNYPAARLGELLAQSRAPVILCCERQAARLDRVLSELHTSPICLITEELWRDGNPERPPLIGGPADLAYVIFTSGSTGKPKGAMVEQRGMLNNIFGKLPALGLGETDRLAQTASPAFDISVWQFLAAPLVGGAVHILPDEITSEPARLLQTVDEQQITLLEVVPSVMRAMLADAPAKVSLHSLRWLMSIGEALPPALCRQWFARFPRVPLLNLYGPAECADNIGFHPITEAPADDCAHMPIGRPTANNQLYVLDDTLRPLPVGVPGEICTAGVGVGRGYLDDAERTRSVFVPHPFQPGERFYRTGDIGRLRPDGVIDYLGRRDHQVKVRGQRVELGEIENRLAEHPGVKAAAVLALPDQRGDTHLVACWQAVAPTDADPAALQTYLAARLPSYMVPAVFVAVEQLPLNANGKLDRKALTAFVQARAPVSRAGRTPQSPAEIGIAAVFKAVLSLVEVGADDNFFTLGGHSLLATQVIARLRSTWQIELPLRSLFDHPTVAQLALQIEQALARGQSASLPPLKPQPRVGRLPLSFAQQRLWFSEQLAPGRAVFTIPFVLEFTGALDIEALCGGFNHLIARHELLRTAFVAEQGEPELRILLPYSLDLPLIDMTGISADAQKAGIEERLAALFATPFDLSQPPLLRAQLFRCSAECHVLALALHHILIDDWSLGLFTDDWMAAYCALRQGEQPDPAPPSLQYADFALWQRRYLAGAQWERDLTYWRRQLAACPATLSLPGRLAGEIKAARGERLRRRIPVAQREALQQQADRSGASLFMVLHTALTILLHQQTGQTDIVIGTDIANRRTAETETMLGFFINPLILRTRLQPEWTCDALLAHCRDVALEAYQHQDLPFDTLVAELLPHRDPQQSPFFQVKLLLQNAPQRDLELPGLRIDEWPLEPQPVEMDLLINCIPSSEGLEMIYNFDTNRYPRRYIEQLAELYEYALAGLAQVDRAVADSALSLQQLQRRLQDAALSEARAVREQQRAALGNIKRKSIPSISE